ncbi:MAG: TIGR02281 family clan AA aspartic protease [Planctomycetes bacterium]|nr:TIGR02281 family clan AA aspartic protease [Planctomycetota bacterium]
MEIAVSPGSPARLTVRVYGPHGVREIPALLDTGASVFTITPDAAIELGYDLHLAPKVTVATASGPAEAPRILLSRVQVGEFCFEGVPTLCLNVSSLGVSRLLGMNILAQLNVFLNNKTATLLITDP